MLKAAQDAIAAGVNQYPPGLGIAPLREAIAAQRHRQFGIDYDPGTEVLVTVGATEAIASAVLGLVEPGSEVVLIEPFYDSYSPWWRWPALTASRCPWSPTAAASRWTPTHCAAR